MKKETLAKRLAEKTATPILEQVLLGEAPMEALPLTCMPWLGKVDHQGGKHRPMRRWTESGIAVDRSRTIPYGVINYAKKSHMVHRLIFIMINKPNFEFRMIKDCGTDRCVNPYHWTVIGEEPEVPEATPNPEPPPGLGAWTIEEVEEVLEVILEGEPTTVGGHPDLYDAPPEMVREVLTKFHKEHLL